MTPLNFLSTSSKMFIAHGRDKSFWTRPFFSLRNITFVFKGQRTGR